MKSSLTIILLLALTSFSFGQKSTFLHPNFEQLSKHHTTIAIVPFEVDIELDHPLSELKRRQLAEEESLAIQRELSYSLMEQQNQWGIRIQPFNQTRSLMKSSGVDYRSSLITDSKKLAEILGVDAVIRGSASLNVLISEGINEQFSWIDLTILSPDFGRITLKLVDGISEKLLWRYEKVMDRTTGKNTRELIEKMMKQASRNFPYSK